MAQCRSLFFSIVTFLAKLFGPFLAPIIAIMARTGAGTNACLRWKCLPLPVHFYSPVPDLSSLEDRKVWDHRSKMAGIDFRPLEQIEYLLSIAKRFGHECVWPQNPLNAPPHYFTSNPSFSYGCAAVTHCMLRHLEPQRVIEIGSGYSSLIIENALEKNGTTASKRAEHIIVDPYPAEFLVQSPDFHDHLVQNHVEQLTPSFFSQLSAGDVLFIDSGHTVRIGSDVNFLLLEVVPLLRPGVVIHIHDICLPHEYPKAYATNPNFRMLWTEQYLLQAFLCFNSDFEILLAMTNLIRERLSDFQQAFPEYDISHHGISSSFWIERKDLKI